MQQHTLNKRRIHPNELAEKTGTNFKGQKIEENESIRVIGMKNKQMEWKRYEMLSARARYLHYHICWLVQQSEL